MYKKGIKLLASLVVVLGMASCAPTKVVYLQDIAPEISIAVKEAALIRFEPSDRLHIKIHSRDPEIVRIFNLLSDTPYTINSRGYIDMPVLGPIKIAGLTRDEAINEIKYKLLDLKLVKDPVVTIEYEGMGYYLLGEINHKGRKEITKDNITLLQALSEAGDLNIDGRRDNILVLRTVNGEQTPYRVSLLDVESLYSSPVYYIKQNDIIYVEPNNKKRASTGVNGTAVLTPGFWISMFTFAVSVVSLLTR